MPSLPFFFFSPKNPRQGSPLVKDLSPEQVANLFPWQRVGTVPRDILLVTQPGHRAASISAGGGHHICKQNLLPCRMRFPLTLFVTSEKCRQYDKFGSGGREIRGCWFLAFIGGETEAQKGQRAVTWNRGPLSLSLPLRLKRCLHQEGLPVHGSGNPNSELQAGEL